MKPFASTLIAGMLLAVSQLPVRAQSHVLMVDFKNLLPAVEIKARGYFKGQLPSNFPQDYTGWNPGHCVAEHKMDDLGEHYLDLNILKPAPQFRMSLKGIQSGKFYKLTIDAKNQLGRKVDFYLRQIHAPYASLKNTFTIPPSDKFVTRVFPFCIKRDLTGIEPGVFISFSHLGHFQLKKLQVQEITQKEFTLLQLDNVKAAIRCQPTAPNFFRHTVFPYGLQSGWTQFGNNECSRATVGTDPDVLGPTGFPALRIHCPQGTQGGICSEPVLPAKPLENMTFSFYYRGSGTFEAKAFVNGDYCRGTCKLQPDPKTWKRAKLTVRIPVNHLSATLRVIGEGTLHVDGFRAANQGQGDYLPTADHEISFVLPESDASLGRVQFEDEPPVVHYFLSGKPAKPVTVTVSVTDLYGKTIQLTPRKAPCGTLSYLSPDLPPYGQFRVEAQAFQAGKPISHPAEIVITRLPRPVYWGKDAPNSPFGIHMNQMVRDMKALKAGGFNWVRFHDGGTFLTSWHNLEPEKGTWNFQDDLIKQYRDNHLMLFGQLGGAPAWATELKNLPQHPSRWYGARYFAPTPDHEKDYEHYCQVVTRRYKGIIDDWFIWNEPWGALFFHKSWNPQTRKYITWGSIEKTAAYYTYLTKLTYKNAKIGNPNCRISGFGAYGAPPSGKDESWSEYFCRNGGYDFCDDIDYHDYFQTLAGFPEDGVLQDVREAFDGILRRRKDLGKPFIMSEGQAGSPSVASTIPRVGIYKRSLSWQSVEDYHDIADSNVRYMLSLLAAGAKRVFLYTAHGYTDLSRGSALQVMLGADGYPHPALVAMAALALRVEDHDYLRCQKLAEHLYGYVFTKGEKTTVVISSDMFLKARITVSPIPGGAPVQLSDLYGNPQSDALAFAGRIAYVTAACPADQLLRSLTVSLQK